MSVPTVVHLVTNVTLGRVTGKKKSTLALLHFFSCFTLLIRIFSFPTSNSDLDSDCQDGYTCGTDNCKTDFIWENGNSNYDCCEATGAIADSSLVIFDKWNVEGSSCGIVNGQTVFAGCSYTYIVEEECLKQCEAYGGICVETEFNIDGWVDPASATKDGERARLLRFFVMYSLS